MFRIYYICNGKLHIDLCTGQTEQDVIDGFDMAHAYDKVTLLNIEKI